MSDRLWFVWKKDGDLPMYQHPSRHDAENEAKRLARTVGGAYYVALAVTLVERTDITVTPLVGKAGDEDIPF